MLRLQIVQRQSDRRIGMLFLQTKHRKSVLCLFVQLISGVSMTGKWEILNWCFEVGTCAPGYYGVWKWRSSLACWACCLRHFSLARRFLNHTCTLVSLAPSRGCMRLGDEELSPDLYQTWTKTKRACSRWSEIPLHTLPIPITAITPAWQGAPHPSSEPFTTKSQCLFEYESIPRGYRKFFSHGHHV